MLSAGGMLRTGVIRHFDITLRLATPDIRLAQALMLSRWWAADARVERMGARPNRAVVVKTALTCGSYSHSSMVLGYRPERKRIYLVTMPARFKRFEGSGYAVATVGPGVPPGNSGPPSPFLEQH